MGQLSRMKIDNMREEHRKKLDSRFLEKLAKKNRQKLKKLKRL